MAVRCHSTTETEIFMTIFGHTARHERQHARAGLTRSGQGQRTVEKGDRSVHYSTVSGNQRITNRD